MLWAAPLMLALAGAEPETSNDEEFKNAVSLKGGYAFQLHRSRESELPGVEAPENDHLGGFLLAYERTLVPGWFGVEFAKPFYFAPNRFDSPFDLTFKLLHRWKFFEPFLGVGLTFNVRIFDREREEIEGRRNDLSFGIIAAAGAAFWVSRRWAIEIEGGYGFIPIGSLVAHEFTTAVGPLFAF